MAKNKEFLNKLIQEARQKKFEREKSEGLIKAVGDEIKEKLTPKNIEDVAVNMGNEIKEALVKSIGELNLNDHVSKAVGEIKITTPEVKVPEIVVNVPEVKLPTINVPEPKVTVNVPEFPKIPDFPSIEMPSTMEIFGKLDYDYKEPLPVRLVTLDGKPYEAIGGYMGGGSSGVSSSGAGSTSFSLVNADGSYYNSDNPLPVSATFSAAAVQPVSQVSGHSWSVFASFDTTASLYNADNRLRVSLETGGSGLTDAELRASSLDVKQTSGTVSSVIVNEIFGSTGTNLINPDNRLKVELPSGSSGLTDTELRASHLDVQQLSGSTDSVNVVSTVGLTDTQLRASTIDVKQVSGSVDSVSVTNTVTVTGAVTATGGGYLTNSELRAATVDVKQVSGSIDSVSVTNTVTVSATDLDVRDLDFATDDISVYQVSGASWSVTVNGTPTVSVTDIFGTVGANVVNSDGRLKVELPSGASGLTDTELRASHLDVQQVSGAVDSVNITNASLAVTGTFFQATQPVSVTDIFATSATSNVVNPDNRVKVELPSGSSGLTDTELRASHLDVDQVSGSAWSTVVVGPINQGDEATALRIVQAGNSISSMSVAAQGITLETRQVSGASHSVNVLAGTITTVTTVTSITNSVAAVGNVASDVADNGDGPIKIGGIARTANPTAVAAGDRVSFTSDDLGRQVMRPVQVRDLIRTAYVSVSNGTETTLLAATAGSFNDLVMITATNNSTAATQLDIRCTTGGNIIHTMYLPATTGPVGWSPGVPWPQDATGNNWTIDMPDQTGTTVYVSALFSQEA